MGMHYFVSAVTVVRIPRRDRPIPGGYPRDLVLTQNFTLQELSVTQQAYAMLKSMSDPKKQKVKGLLTAAQQKEVSKAMHTRAAHEGAQELAGTSVANAKAVEVRRNGRAWGEREAAALGVETRNVTPPPSFGMNAVNEAYAARYRAGAQRNRDSG